MKEKIAEALSLAIFSMALELRRVGLPPKMCRRFMIDMLKGIDWEKVKG